MSISTCGTRMLLAGGRWSTLSAFQATFGHVSLTLGYREGEAVNRSLPGGGLDQMAGKEVGKTRHTQMDWDCLLGTRIPHQGVQTGTKGGWEHCNPTPENTC